MRYEANYKVKTVTHTEKGTVFEARQHIKSGLPKYRHIKEIEVPEGIDIKVGDIVKVKIENHSDKSGERSTSWALDKFIGFPYDRERAGWYPIDGYRKA